MPTAMHESAVGQDTQNSWPVGTRGFGLGVTDHPAPEALAGAARTLTRSAGTSSRTDLFITIPHLNEPLMVASSSYDNLTKSSHPAREAHPTSNILPVPAPRLTADGRGASQ